MIDTRDPFSGLNVTFNTNENCTLKCHYCYEFFKPANIDHDQNFWKLAGEDPDQFTYPKLHQCKQNTVLDFQLAKNFIDMLIEEPDPIRVKGTDLDWIYDGVVLDFIGGDSLQYPELVDDILSYFCYKANIENHPWATKWRTSISSNGVTLLNPKAREIAEKWEKNMSLGISIDGCPELHDKHRVLFASDKNGHDIGSWKYIEKVIPWWKQHFPVDADSTKFTFVPDSYSYIMKSVKFLHEELGMHYINLNQAMEQSIYTSQKQRLEFYDQLLQLMDYVWDRRDSMYCSLLDYNFYSSATTLEEAINTNGDKGRCGGGNMPALSVRGDIYPCFRCLDGHDSVDVSDWAFGNARDKTWNFDAVTAFQEKTKISKTTREEQCFKCKVNSSCPYCIAGCGLQSKKDGIEDCFVRTTSVCGYIHIVTDVARRYWERYNVFEPEKAKKRGKEIIWDLEYRDWTKQILDYKETTNTIIPIKYKEYKGDK